MTKTKIDWCDYTWNPVWGCKNNCPFCYARKIAQRFKMIKNFNNPEWIESNFNKSFLKKPSRIFVNSMSDMYFWKPEWMVKVLHKIYLNPRHIFLFLTKFPNIYNQYDFDTFTPNILKGITITKNKDIPQNIKMNNLFFSIEPILEFIDIKINYKVKWIIVGAETGNRKNKVIPKKEWIENIRLYCKKNNIPYFEKDSINKIVKRKLIREFPIDNIK